MKKYNYNYKIEQGRLTANSDFLTRFVDYLTTEKQYKDLPDAPENTISNGWNVYFTSCNSGTVYSVSGQPDVLEYDVEKFLKSSVDKVFKRITNIQQFAEVYLCGSFVINQLHGLGDAWDDIDFVVFPNYSAFKDSHLAEKAIIDNFKKEFPGESIYTPCNYPNSTMSIKVQCGGIMLNLLFKGSKCENSFVEQTLSSYKGFPIVPLRDNFQAKAGYNRDKDRIQLAKIAADVLRPVFEK